MDVDGSHQTRLTRDESGKFANAEPCTIPSAPTPEKGKGVIRHLEGEPAWSPDGLKIGFTSTFYCHPYAIVAIAGYPTRTASAEIYTMDCNDSQPVRLTHNDAFDGRPSWSPDVLKIAFESDRDGNSEIYLADANGSNQTRITKNDAFNGQPAWSPDGNKIAALRKGGLLAPYPRESVESAVPKDLVSVGAEETVLALGWCHLLELA